MSPQQLPEQDEDSQHFTRTPREGTEESLRLHKFACINRFQRISFTCINFMGEGAVGSVLTVAHGTHLCFSAGLMLKFVKLSPNQASCSNASTNSKPLPQFHRQGCSHPRARQSLYPHSKTSLGFSLANRNRQRCACVVGHY